MQTHVKSCDLSLEARRTPRLYISLLEADGNLCVIRGTTGKWELRKSGCTLLFVCFVAKFQALNFKLQKWIVKWKRERERKKITLTVSLEQEIDLVPRSSHCVRLKWNFYNLCRPSCTSIRKILDHGPQISQASLSPPTSVVLSAPNDHLSGSATCVVDEDHHSCSSPFLLFFLLFSLRFSMMILMGARKALRRV